MNFDVKYSDSTVKFLMIVITLYCVFLSGIPIFKATFTSRLTFDGILVDKTNTSDNLNKGIKISNVYKNGTGFEAGLRVNDEILSIDGININNYLQYRELLSEKENNTFAIYTINRNNSVLTIPVKVVRLFHLLFYIFSFLGFGFLINGFFVGYSKPKDKSAIIFFLLGISASLGLQSLGGVWNYISVDGFLYYNYTLGLAFFFPLFFHFFLTFPLEINFKNKRYFILAIYFFPLILNIFAYFIESQNNNVLLFFSILQLVPFLYIFFGVLIYLKSFSKIKDNNLRKPLKIIIWGLISGMVGFIYYFLVPLLNLPGQIPNFISRIPLILVLFIPISFGYSIFKYKILNIENIVKKGFVYTVLSFIILSSYLLLIIFLDSIFTNYTGLNKQVITIIVIILIIFVFDFVNKRLKEFVESTFYKHRYNYRKTLLNFSENLPFIKNADEIFTKLAFIIKDVMKIQYVDIWFNDNNYVKTVTNYYEISNSRENSDFNAIYKELFRINKMPVFITSENSISYLFSQSQRKLLKQENIVLSIPILYKHILIGSINLGRRIENSFYSDEDVDLLFTLASHAALAFESSRLRVLEYQSIKIEEELNVARKIQSSLLPKSDFSVSGIELSAAMIPAKFVGGDFYDFIKLSDEKTLIIIADVSGKGTPAALYMAKVQALAQIASSKFESPKEFLIELNKRLYNKSNRHIFITMIAALVNVGNNTVTLARAGHNPPIICNDNQIDIPQPKGIGLGLDPDVIFKNNLDEITFFLKNNSICVFYTDGLNEAMNFKKEEFTINNVVNLIKKYKDLSSNEIKDRILEDIHNFRDGAEQNDDITVVILKTKQ